MDDAAPPDAFTTMENATADGATAIGRLQPDDADAPRVAVEEPPARAPLAEDA